MLSVSQPIGSRTTFPRLSPAQSATPHRLEGPQLEGRPDQSATRIDSSSRVRTSARGAPRPAQHQLEENLPRVSAIIPAFGDKVGCGD